MPRPKPKKPVSPLKGLAKQVQDKHQRQTKKTKGPVWAGPESPEKNGGITFSLLSRFLSCRERFRLLVVNGLKPDEGFSHRLHYGLMWHICEEEWAGPHPECWENSLKGYVQGLMKQYPMSQDDILKWYNVCRVQFPVYVEFWSKHRDVTEKTPLLQEQVFCVPYQLPSGRTVYLRGKWDSVDLLGSGKGQAIYLKENKTKGEINEFQLRRQLTFDLQTMMYLVALRHQPDLHPKINGTAGMGRPVAGVIYNVVRRPLSGGKGNIRPHQATKTKPAESLADYYKRLQDVIKEEPSYWFMRWRVEVSPRDVELFRRQCLDPILEQLCDWWEFVVSCQREPENLWKSRDGLHYRTPFGWYNPLAEGASSELDEFLATGSSVGLMRTANLFPELQEE